jgi:hypothetical protein
MSPSPPPPVIQISPSPPPLVIQMSPSPPPFPLNDINICGNKICEKIIENLRNCPKDCNPICGNGICEIAEDITRCPDDCMI